MSAPRHPLAGQGVALTFAALAVVLMLARFLGSPAHVAAMLGRLWASLVAWLPAGGWQRPVSLIVAVAVLGGLAVAIWRLTRPGPGIVLGRTGVWAGKVWLSLRASCQHCWILGPIGTGKTVTLGNIILGEIRADPDPHIEKGRRRRRRRRMACRKLGPGRAVVAIDPNGALTGDVLARLSPVERERVTVIDPLDDNPPAINLFAAADPALAAEFILSLFRRLPGGGSVGPIQLDILRRGIVSLARVKGATLIDLPRHLVATAGDSEAKEVRGLVARLTPFLSPSIANVIGGEEKVDVFAGIDSGRTLIVRMREELGEEPAMLLAAVVLARLWERLQRRPPKVPRRHVTIVLDELGAVVREGRVLARILDQARSRNVSLICAHQRISQLEAVDPALVDALKGSALTRIVFRLGDHTEATHMAKQLTGGVTAEKLMSLPDFTTLIRRRAKGRPLAVRMYDLPKSWRPPLRGRFKARIEAFRAGLQRRARGQEIPHAPHAGTPRAPRRVTAIRVDDAPTPTVPPQIARIEPARGPETEPKTPSEFRPSTDQQIPTINQTPSSAPVSPLPSLPGLRVTPRDLDVLTLIADHAVATSDQLARAYWADSTGAKRLATADTGPARKRLAALAKAGALKATGPNGRPQQHYSLTALGARLIGREAWQPSKLEDRALPHRLAVVDFGTALLGGARAVGGTLRWDGEAALCRDESLPADVRPDGRVVLTTPAGSLTAWVEIDRGTESWAWLTGKLERLAAHGGADAILVAFTMGGRAKGAAGRLPVADGIVVAGALLPAHVADPLGAIWTPARAASPVSLLELAGKVAAPK